MKQETIDRFLSRNGREELEEFINDTNEYFDPYILLLSVIDDEWEYGYGNYSFEYYSVDDFLERSRGDIERWGKTDDILHLALGVQYYEDSDESRRPWNRITIDET